MGLIPKFSCHLYKHVVGELQASHTHTHTLQLKSKYIFSLSQVSYVYYLTWESRILETCLSMGMH